MVMVVNGSWSSHWPGFESQCASSWVLLWVVSLLMAGIDVRAPLHKSINKSIHRSSALCVCLFIYEYAYIYIYKYIYTYVSVNTNMN